MITFQQLAKKYGISDYPDFREKTRAFLSRERARQIWYGTTGIGYKKATELSRALKIPYEALRGVVPSRDGNQSLS